MEPFFEKRATTQTDYARFVQLLTAQPDRLVVDNIDLGFQRLQSEEETVLFEDLNAVKSQASESMKRTLQVIATVSTEQQNIALARNSPLRPALDWATRRVRESGAAFYLQAKWEGKDLSSAAGADVETISLTVGHVILGFVLLASLLVAAAIAFLFETGFHWLKNRNKGTSSIST